VEEYDDEERRGYRSLLDTHLLHGVGAREIKRLVNHHRLCKYIVRAARAQQPSLVREFCFLCFPNAV
jgi:hypothetical protein